MTCHWAFRWATLISGLFTRSLMKGLCDSWIGIDGTLFYIWDRLKLLGWATTPKTPQKGFNFVIDAEERELVNFPFSKGYTSSKRYVATALTIIWNYLKSPLYFIWICCTLHFYSIFIIDVMLFINNYINSYYLNNKFNNK